MSILLNTYFGQNIFVNVSLGLILLSAIIFSGLKDPIIDKDDKESV